MKTKQMSISVMLYLIACALHNEKPDENKLAGIDLNLLYHMARKHSLSAIICMALQNTDVFQNSDPTLKKQWQESKEKTIRKNIMLDAERKQIFAEMEKRHIWYLPLKGIVIKSFYPHEGMREMADNDILYDIQYQKDVKTIFTSRGYKVILYAQGKHDVYKKEPVYSYEMHTSLFSPYTYPKLYSFFENIQDKLIPDSDSAYGRHLSCEDLYIYVTAHAYMHHNKSGTGLRTLVDYYVMDKKYCDVMDRKYISDQLRQIEADDYEKSCLKLAKHLFDKTELVDISKLSLDEQKAFEYCFSSGTYGSIENRIKTSLKKYRKDGSRLSKWSKIKYYLRRIFPGRERCRVPYPFLYRFPVFMPFFWIYRIYKLILLLLFNKEWIKNEIHIVQKMSDSDIEE